MAAAGDNAGAERNLRAEAAAAGSIRPGWFSPRGSRSADHLARHRARRSVSRYAALTMPTRRQATRCGPGCRGDLRWERLSRAGWRASLLTAIGLPELVTHSLDDYEALARRLAADRPLLAGLRAQLEQNRRRFPCSIPTGFGAISRPPIRPCGRFGSAASAAQLQRRSTIGQAHQLYLILAVPA